MKNTKIAKVTALTFAGALALTACSSDTDGASGGSGAGENVEVTIWQLQMEDSQQTAWDALVAGFETANPGITIKTEERQVDPHKDALRQAAGTDTGPDLYRYWGGYGLGGQLVGAGMSKDLTEYYEQYGWADQLTGAALGNATQYGKHDGVPVIQATEALFYNKELFAQAGITELPTTYDELVEAAEKLKAAGITPIEFGGTVNWDVMRLLDSIIENQCGAETADKLIKADGDWSSEPCVTASFTELKKWGDNYFNEGFMAISADDSAQAFFTGNAAMALEGDWFGPQAIDGGLPAENIGIFPFPTETGRLYGFGEMLYMTPSTKNADAAAKFLDYLISEEGQAAIGNAFGALSVNKNVTQPEGTPLAAEWQNVLASATGSYMNNDQNFDTAETAEYWRIQNSVLIGDIAPDQAGAEFQKWRAANK